MDVDYDEYINSMAWKIKRNRMIVEASWTCQKCGATNTALEVHHLTYDNLGNEEPEDLMVLCKKCHAELTEKADRKKRGGRAGYWATLNKWALKNAEAQNNGRLISSSPNWMRGLVSGVDTR